MVAFKLCPGHRGRGKESRRIPWGVRNGGWSPEIRRLTFIPVIPEMQGDWGLFCGTDCTHDFVSFCSCSCKKKTWERKRMGGDRYVERYTETEWQSERQREELEETERQRDGETERSLNSNETAVSFFIRLPSGTLPFIPSCTDLECPEEKPGRLVGIFLLFLWSSTNLFSCLLAVCH